LNKLTYKTGEQRVFLKTGADTDGELLEMDVTYIPDSPRPPMHYHPNQEEKFEVIAGRFKVNIAGDERIYNPGDTFIVPKNTEHWMQNVSTEQGRVNWQVRPALRTQEFFTKMWHASENSPGEGPGIVQLAVLLTSFRNEFIVSNPPLPVQRILFGILAPIGRLLGYKA
jgi:quercetin dioxygenase-like cupin family protein